MQFEKKKKKEKKLIVVDVLSTDSLIPILD